jgi:hypothetical protein
MQLAVLRYWRELLRVAAAANQPIDAISYRKDREPRARDRAGDASIMLRVIGHEAHRKCWYRNSRQQRGREHYSYWSFHRPIPTLLTTHQRQI